MRKFGIGLCGLVLLASLLIIAFSTSTNLALKQPGNVKKWLYESNLYGAFVENAIDQAERTAGTDQSGGISLSDTAVKQAAQSSFSSQTLQKDVNTFLDSNYAWLQGKTSTPSFSINLTQAKQNFANQVGSYVTTFLNGLPVCTPTQLAQLNPQTTDPLTLTCRPQIIDPATEGTEVTTQIAHSHQFLSNPVVTAATINPNGNIQNQGQPYYQRFSSAPTLYRINTKLPWVASIVALLSAIGVMLLAARKRGGLKILAILVALAGAIVLLTKLVADQTFNTLEKHVFNASTVGQLQKALTIFFHHAETQIVKTDMWFGVGYLIIALILVVILFITRQRRLRRFLTKTNPLDAGAATTQSSPARPSVPTPDTNEKAPRPKSSRPPKPRRLVQ